MAEAAADQSPYLAPAPRRTPWEPQLLGSCGRCRLKAASISWHLTARDMAMDHEQLVRRASGGDVEAFVDLTRRFQHFAFGLALAQIGRASCRERGERWV